VQVLSEVVADLSQTKEGRARLESCLQATCDTLEKEKFDESIPRRIEACIATGWWHTKY
jgi:hypothetical protein